MELRSINTDAELRALLDASRERPVLLFKHSTMCPISSAAHGEVRRFLAGAADPTFDVGMIVVQTARPLSNKVADELSVEHETPQAIVVRDGKAVWNASHRRITEASLAEALRAG